MPQPAPYEQPVTDQVIPVQAIANSDSRLQAHPPGSAGRGSTGLRFAKLVLVSVRCRLAVSGLRGGHKDRRGTRISWPALLLAS